LTRRCAEILLLGKLRRSPFSDVLLEASAVGRGVGGFHPGSYIKKAELLFHEN
jgi:hypothetical protein